MSQVVISTNAARNLDRLQIYLQSKNPPAAKNAAQSIKKTLKLLADNPQMGRPVDDMDGDYR